jgi:hypothetical protein
MKDEKYIKDRIKVNINRFSTGKTSDNYDWYGFRLDSGVAVRILDDRIEYWLRNKPNWIHYTSDIDDAIEHCRKYAMGEPHDEEVNWRELSDSHVYVQMPKPKYILNESITLVKEKTLQYNELKENIDITKWKEWDQSVFSDMFMYNIINEFQAKLLIGSIINVRNGHTLSDKVKNLLIVALSKIANNLNFKVNVKDIV